MISSPFFPKTDRDALIVLNAIPGLGNKRVLELWKAFGSPVKVWEALSTGVLRSMGLSQPLVLNMETFNAAEFLEREEVSLKACGGRIITLLDEGYPPGLREVPDAPAVLYVQGEFPQGMECSFAIVGSRRPTLYGLQMAEKFSRELSEIGVPIVSGLARGIDAAAHRGCLRSGGKTVGVLGCGLDVVYPRENAALFNEIRKSGCIISEFPFGTPPLAYNFPRRNRIVSGLSLGVLVVEAQLKSGALITADFALEQGREVFALPGRADSPLSQGPHAIIKQGAKMVLSVEDILEELPIRQREIRQGPREGSGDSKGVAPEEKELLGIIKEGPVSLEALQGRTGRDLTGLIALLLSLQIKRVVREMPGKIYEFVRGR